MLRFNRKITVAICLGVAFSLTACTDAKRLWDDKTASKNTPAPRTNEPTVTLKASPPQSPKATTAATATFSGDIAGKAGKRLLYQLLEKNDKKSVKLDLLLSDDQLAQLDEVDKGKKWYFDLAYEGQDGFNTGGELLIDITKGKGDLRLSGNHLTGSILITNWSGPKQGLMSISAKPASHEATSTKKEEPKSSPQSEKKKKESAANNPPL